MPEIHSGAIAILGLSGRFPGAPDAPSLWQLLADGRDGVAEAPADRPWMRELYDPAPRAPGKVPTTRGGFLPQLAMFDTSYFGMSAREARRMDPQQRLLLETSVEAAEDAGLPLCTLAGPRTGVYMGAVHADYWLRQTGDLPGLDMYAEIGSSRCAIAGRLAYALALRGPVIQVDTACASALLSGLTAQRPAAGQPARRLRGGQLLPRRARRAPARRRASRHRGELGLLDGDRACSSAQRAQRA
jgi:acyl transferase domain-containing protein